MAFFFITIFSLFTFFTFWTLQKTGFSIFKIGLVQFVVTSLFVFSFLGTLPLFFGWDEYRVSLGIINQILVFKVMAISGLSMILVITGANIGKFHFKKMITGNNRHDIRYNKKEIFIISLFLFFIILVLFNFLSKIPNIALLVALNTGITEGHMARSTMVNNFPGKYHWYSLVIHDLSNIVTFSLLSVYLLTRKKVYLLLFMISFIVSAFSAIMTTEKAPFAWLLIGLCLTYSFVQGGGRYTAKTLLTITLTVLITLVFFYIYFMGSNFESGISSVFSRAFAGSIQPAYHYLELFPDKHSFLLGTSFPNPGGIMPFKPYPLTAEVMNFANPTNLRREIGGSMPTVFWGEMYANFGFGGVLFFPIFVGFVLYSIEYILSHFIHSPLKIGVYIWTLLHYKDLSITGLSMFLADFYLFGVILFFIVISGAANGGKLKIKKNRSLLK